MIKKLNSFLISLNIFIKLIPDLVCSQETYYILNEYKNKDFSNFEMDSLLVKNEIECLRKCSLSQPCVFIKFNQKYCGLYGDKNLNLNNFLKTTKKYSKFFNGSYLSNLNC